MHKYSAIMAKKISFCCSLHYSGAYRGFIIAQTLYILAYPSIQLFSQDNFASALCKFKIRYLRCVPSFHALGDLCHACSHLLEVANSTLAEIHRHKVALRPCNPVLSSILANLSAILPCECFFRFVYFRFCFTQSTSALSKARSTALFAALTA